WKAALDATVIKQGVFPLVFHPHGWSKPEQFIDLIDYAEKKYGKKVKFLTFREAQERLNKNMLDRHPLRIPKTGAENGVVLMDYDRDGYLDVLIDDKEDLQVRSWARTEKGRAWTTEKLKGFKSEKLPGLEGFTTYEQLEIDGTDIYVAKRDKEQSAFLMPK